jgi:hypothetical protein
MHIGDHLPVGINQHNCLTIRHLDDQTDLRHVSDQCIADQQRGRTGITAIEVAVIDYTHPITVDLTGINELAVIEASGDELSVFFNAVMIIADIVRNI